MRLARKADEDLFDPVVKWVIKGGAIFAVLFVVGVILIAILRAVG